MLTLFAAGQGERVRLRCSVQRAGLRACEGCSWNEGPGHLQRVSRLHTGVRLGICPALALGISTDPLGVKSETLNAQPASHGSALVADAAVCRRSGPPGQIHVIFAPGRPSKHDPANCQDLHLLHSRDGAYNCPLWAAQPAYSCQGRDQGEILRDLRCGKLRPQ